MELVEIAKWSPGACGICRGHTSPIVDTLQERVEGRLYVCTNCVRELAVTGGALDQAQAAVNAAEERADEADELRAELDRLRMAIRTTLNEGAVRTRQGGHKLRQKNGHKAPAL